MTRGAALLEKVQRCLDLVGGQMELSPGQYLGVFCQDAIVDAHLDGSIDHEVEQAPAEPIGVNEGGDEDVRVNDDPPHFCFRRARRAAAISTSMSSIVNVSTPAVFAAPRSASMAARVRARRMA